PFRSTSLPSSILRSVQLCIQLVSILIFVRVLRSKSMEEYSYTMEMHQSQISDRSMRFVGRLVQRRTMRWETIRRWFPSMVE
ncbi:hypothetical protein PFISCL1PPCAC_1802, partial [Pristionchus fissidentatus]